MSTNDPLFGLTDGSAMVTGAASGIGRTVAIALAARGVGVLCVDRAGSDLTSVAAEAAKAGGRTHVFEADVLDEDALVQAVRTGEEVLGPLAYALNAAGINIPEPTLEMSRENWDKVMGVNATGVVFSCKAQGAAMLRHGRGSIVNIASMSGSIINYGLDHVAYCASKAAVKHMTKSLAVEWAKQGVRVNSISPGYTQTPMLLQVSAETRKVFTDTTPIGRLADPSEMVGPVLFLLSPAASYVTGHDLLADGGHTVW